MISGFLEGSVVKNLPTDAGDAGSILGSGRCPRGGNGNPLQYSSWNRRGRGAWKVIVHGVATCQIELSMQAHAISTKPYLGHAVLGKSQSWHIDGSACTIRLGKDFK